MGHKHKALRSTGKGKGLDAMAKEVFYRPFWKI